MTLTDFLLARIEEDEATARAVRPGPWMSVLETGDDAEDFGTIYGPDGWDDQVADWHGTGTGDFIARHDPARILAECAAKRVAVNWYLNDDDVVMAATVEALAAVYADHPDYDPDCGN